MCQGPTQQHVQLVLHVSAQSATASSAWTHRMYQALQKK
jgi:hypothetical protein